MDWNDLRTRKFLVTAVALVLLVGAGWALANYGTGGQADLGLADADDTASATNSETSLDGENVMLATDADGNPIGDDSNGDSSAGDDSGDDSGDTGTPGDGTGSDSSDGGSSDPDDPANPADPADPDATMTVMVLFWNDTQDAAPDGAEILLGAKSFSPDTNGESDAGSLAGLPFGEEITLTVYPDGRDGEKLTVPITFTSGMKPDSEQDAIHVEVSDDKVRVLGNAVSNFDVTFDRF